MFIKRLAGVLTILSIIVLLASFSSAGVGLRWNMESQVVSQGEKTCFTYSVYNPWPKDSFARIDVSPELKDILKSQDNEATLIPANTPSSKAIPLKFCFEVPYVYKEGRSCLLGNYLCDQKCNIDPKTYSGEVLVTESGGLGSISGAGGSSTSLTVSAPLSIKVACVAHGRDYKPVYFFLLAASLVVIVLLVVRKYRKPKIERYEEEMKKLKERIKKEKRTKK